MWISAKMALETFPHQILEATEGTLVFDPQISVHEAAGLTNLIREKQEKNNNNVIDTQQGTREHRGEISNTLINK